MMFYKKKKLNLFIEKYFSRAVNGSRALKITSEVFIDEQILNRSQIPEEVLAQCFIRIRKNLLEAIDKALVELHDIKQLPDDNNHSIGQWRG